MSSFDTIKKNFDGQKIVDEKGREWSMKIRPVVDGSNSEGFRPMIYVQFSQENLKRMEHCHLRIKDKTVKNYSTIEEAQQALSQHLFDSLNIQEWQEKLTHDVSPSISDLFKK